MARAETASASIRSDSIKGLAQSIAKPAYRGLLTAEPALRRAVPALIIAFLITIASAPWFRSSIIAGRAIFDIAKQIEASADVLVERLDQSLTEDSSRAHSKASSSTRYHPGRGRPADAFW